MATTAPSPVPSSLGPLGPSLPPNASNNNSSDSSSSGGSNSSSPVARASPSTLMMMATAATATSTSPLHHSSVPSPPLAPMAPSPVSPPALLAPATPTTLPTTAATPAALVPHSYHLKYHGHCGALSRSLLALLGESHCADVQLTTGDSYQAPTIRAHRLILSACSPYFKSLFSSLPSTTSTTSSSSSCPVIIIREITYETLCAIVEFCYRGKCCTCCSCCCKAVLITNFVQIIYLNSALACTKVFHYYFFSVVSRENTLLLVGALFLSLCASDSTAAVHSFTTGKHFFPCLSCTLRFQGYCRAFQQRKNDSFYFLYSVI